jgi:hypothetical protein
MNIAINYGVTSLEQVLLEELRDAAVLRRRGYAADADLIEKLIGRVRVASEDYLTWLWSCPVSVDS